MSPRPAHRSPRLTTREIAYAALFAALIAAGAFIAIPVGSVPFTLQVLFVLLAGMVLGPRLGALSALAYLALGLIAPVYAGGTSGLGVLLGPTGGYLWGFVLAAALTGWVAGGGREHRVRRQGERGLLAAGASLPRLVAAGLLGVVPIYVLGALWLAAQTGIGVRAAVVTGVAPFVWVDVLKAVGAGLAARALVSLPLALPAPREDR